MPDDPNRPRDMGLYLALAGLGVEMVVPIILGATLDAYLNWTPWATVAGVVLGFVMSLFHMMLLLKRLDKPSQKPPQDEP
ncbi:MAG TPA: AtpZ/AtpI family protein [Gemmataceae bacterium]|nr:AtpZ/AtpI family protein [Gemmataceae bacterium]